MDKQSGAVIERAFRQAPTRSCLPAIRGYEPEFRSPIKAEKALEDIRQYADLSAMTEPTILKINPFGAPIYVLILDTFSDFELASEAKAAWTASRGDQVEPWIRTVESLQTVIEHMDASDS